MPRPTRVALFEEAIKRIRGDVNDIDRLMALTLQTAITSQQRDGLNRNGQGGPSTTDEDADVVLTSVEAAALRRPAVEHERKQALEVLASLAGAERLLARAADLSLVLEDRISPELRNVAEVTCVDDDCEKLRGDGWDDKHPQGVAGRCKACYTRRDRQRRNG